MAKRSSDFGTKLKAAVQKLPLPALKPSPPPEVSAAPPPAVGPPLKDFSSLKTRDFITVLFPPLPGRVPGKIGAEVVAVSPTVLSIKYLPSGKPALAGSLHWEVGLSGRTPPLFRDMPSEREVVVRRANRAESEYLDGLRASHSPIKIIATLTLDGVYAFIYPKSPTKEWVAGVTIGIVTKVVSADFFEVTLYFPEYITDTASGFDPAPVVGFRRTVEPDGSPAFTDTGYNCKVAMVRRPSREEFEQFEKDRKAVLIFRAIPNMRIPG